MSIKYYNQEQGFSFVETLVAITILLVVIIGPMSISATASRSTSFSSEQVIAFFLAQEGLELAQKARDDLLLDVYGNPTPDGWADFVDSSGTYGDCYVPSDGCGLHINTDSTGTLEVTDCSGTGNPCRLYIDGSDTVRARYTYEISGTTESPYTRVIQLDDTDTNEVKAVSTVYWRSGTTIAVQQVQVETYLYNVYGL